MNKLIDNWMNNVKTYPPAEIFFEKYGKEAKSEKRIQDICEDVYRFCFPENQKNLLGDLGQSYRQFQVAYRVGFDGMKPEYIQKVKSEFLADTKFAITALDAMFKKDQILQQYYSNWKVKFSEIDSAVYDMTKEYLID